jgi:hypothetical protein
VVRTRVETILEDPEMPMADRGALVDDVQQPDDDIPRHVRGPLREDEACLQRLVDARQVEQRVEVFGALDRAQRVPGRHAAPPFG